MDDKPQIYLISPPVADARFAERLAAVLDGMPVACLRLALAGDDESALVRSIDICRDIAHARDVPVVLARHVALVERLGLDGVHLDGPRGIRDARKALGADAIVGAFCGASRHDGITAGEAGADYVAFGPVGESHLGDGRVAEDDLFSWWAEMIEIPMVAEGGLTAERVAALCPIVEFIGVGAELWRHEDPMAAAHDLLAPLLVHNQ